MLDVTPTISDLSSANGDYACRTSEHADESTYRLSSPTVIDDDPTAWMSPEELAAFDAEMEAHALAVAQAAINARKSIEKIVSCASKGRFAAAVRFDGTTHKCGTHKLEAEAWQACEYKAHQLRQG